MTECIRNDIVTFQIK